MWQVLASEKSKSIDSWAAGGHWNRGATCRPKGEKYTVRKQTLLYRKDWKRKRKKGRPYIKKEQRTQQNLL